MVNGISGRGRIAYTGGYTTNRANIFGRSNLTERFVGVQFSNGFVAKHYREIMNLEKKKTFEVQRDREALESSFHMYLIPHAHLLTETPSVD